AIADIGLGSELRLADVGKPRLQVRADRLLCCLCVDAGSSLLGIGETLLFRLAAGLAIRGRRRPSSSVIRHSHVPSAWTRAPPSPFALLGLRCLLSPAGIFPCIVVSFVG